MRACHTAGDSLSTQLDEAVVHLREMILRGKLAPGERVAEAPLAEELGMSRTPVRQALPLLAQEGTARRAREPGLRRTVVHGR
jgi:DNA-binding GntR family transcriptional regulator